MRKLVLLLLVLTLTLGACAGKPVPTTATPTETSVPATTVPKTTIPETTVPETTVPPHSELYLEGCSLDDVLAWFDEVVLTVEYSDGTGDPTQVQKWLFPLLYRIEGEPTEEDLLVLERFCQELNQIPGFPGIQMAEGLQRESLTLSFLGPEAFLDRFSDVVGADAWGAVQFWYYTDTNEIHTAEIGYRTDIPQADRSSIILEEIVNALGITDTDEREDSIVYQYSNDNLCLSDVDWLILKLLYHPAMECGMDADQCHAVIRSLYD